MRFCFVTPRYGKQIAGGAETLVRELASRLAQRGDQIEILTTCALDNRSWENHFAPGVEVDQKLIVRRFLVDPRNLDKWVPLQIRISEGMKLSVDEQLDWMAHGVNSTALYAHLAEVSAQFDKIFFGPYLFGTTFWGSLISPERSVLIPCLHDESYAYLEVIEQMFKQVSGALFNALPEQQLAHSLYGEIAGGEVGMGFVPCNQDYVNSLSPYFTESFPYLMYLGRKETGKNAQILIDYFSALKDSGQHPGLKLVILGGGSFDDLLRPNAKLRDDIIDLAQLSELDKQRVLKYAVALCQPSLNESFSIVLMEAWQLGVPVLVHSKCAVTREHVSESGGGLYFSDANEFGAVVSELLNDATLRAELAAAGNGYVRTKYSWSAVLERFDIALANINLPRYPSIDSLACDQMIRGDRL